MVDDGSFRNMWQYRILLKWGKYEIIFFTWTWSRDKEAKFLFLLVHTYNVSSLTTVAHYLKVRIS